VGWNVLCWWEALTECRIDGKVQSVLIGGHDIWDVYERKDQWYCILYEYVYLRWYGRGFG